MCERSGGRIRRRRHPRPARVARVHPHGSRDACPRVGSAVSDLPTLIEKALTDAGYDLIDAAADGWTRARISGGVSGEVQVRAVPGGTVLAVPERAVAERIGLSVATDTYPGMAGSGLAATPWELHRALRLLRTLETHPASRLSAELKARIERIPITERTREVCERIGQDVFREALMEFWDGRCALSGMALPPELLRASHAKPWKAATDEERLDPFNGLLLAVRYDALFDQGLIAFGDDGKLLVAPSLNSEVRAFVGLEDGMRLRFVVPGHVPYLHYHRERVAHL